jgi:hypothetical protein
LKSRAYEEFIVAFHARPQATKDLGVLIEPTRVITEKALDALRDFYGGPIATTPLTTREAVAKPA